MGQGRENSRVFLVDNPDLATEIDTKVRIALKLIPDPDAPPAVVDEPTTANVASSAPIPVPAAAEGRSRSRAPRVPVA
jgi:recombination protein RecA